MIGLTGNKGSNQTCHLLPTRLTVNTFYLISVTEKAFLSHTSNYPNIRDSEVINKRLQWLRIWKVDINTFPELSKACIIFYSYKCASFRWIETTRQTKILLEFAGNWAFASRFILDNKAAIFYSAVSVVIQCGIVNTRETIFKVKPATFLTIPEMENKRYCYIAENWLDLI